MLSAFVHPVCERLSRLSGNWRMCVNFQILYEIELGTFEYWVRSLSTRSVER